MQQLLERCFENALGLSGYPKEISSNRTFSLRLISDDEFYVCFDGAQISITTSAANIISEFFNFVCNDFFAISAFDWVFLHEISHFRLDHFNLSGSFGVAQRFDLPHSTTRLAHSKFYSLVPLCFEMQADHEASEALLGTYSTVNWEKLRNKVLAISEMMMLIELEDTKNGAKGRTHPKAATRIFQLLGHLVEMPLIQAQVQQDSSLIPSKDELQAFAQEVTIPCFFNAIQLSQTAGAMSIANDLGSPEGFFKDLKIAKLSDPSRYTELKTQGAQEWAKLWPCNEALKPILSAHFMT